MTTIIYITISALVLGVGTNVGALGVPAVPSPADEFTVSMGPMQDCPNVTKKMGYSDAFIDRVNDTIWKIKGKIVVTEVLHSPIIVKVEISKCEGDSETDDCKFLMEKESEGCEELNESKGYVFELFNAAGATNVKCPLQPGNYTIKNYTISVPQDKAAGAYMMSQHWKYCVKGLEGGKLIMCNCGRISFIPKESDKEKKAYDFD